VADERDHIERIRDQFSRQADAYARMPQTRDQSALARLVALCAPTHDDCVLDVACGPGFLTVAFATLCGRAVGIDATAALLAHAHEEAVRRSVTNVEFRLGDATRLESADASFDIVACRAAFHHFPDPAAVLREMVRVMRPAGRMLIADMLGSEDARKAEYHDRIERLCDPTHVHALPASEFAAMFANAGLRVDVDGNQQIEYEVEEWMDHGSPDVTVRTEIRRLLAAAEASDLCDLGVRRDAGRLYFSHTGAAFLLRRA
jgi:ubiquinone/menaquinone biosynthesis C-methylase UbiE